MAWAMGSSTISGVSLLETSAVMGERVEVQAGVKATGRMRCFSHYLPLVYIPQCLTFVSLFQTLPFTMTTPQFQPLFQTPLTAHGPPSVSHRPPSPTYLRISGQDP